MALTRFSADLVAMRSSGTSRSTVSEYTSPASLSRPATGACDADNENFNGRHNAGRGGEFGPQWHQAGVKAERHHYAVLSDTYQFLSDSGNWFMWEEHSIADGGTPWS